MPASFGRVTAFGAVTGEVVFLTVGGKDGCPADGVTPGADGVVVVATSDGPPLLDEDIEDKYQTAPSTTTANTIQFIVLFFI
jgi:hypothetical protein